MTDNLSASDRLRTMRAVKSKQTRPERRLRALLAGLQLKGWKLNYEQVPGKPDIAFPAQRIAIFVNGCFWHGCQLCKRPLPETNKEYWIKKIQRNIDRDKRYDNELTEAGWKIVRLWEHQFKKGESWHELVKQLRDDLK